MAGSSRAATTADAGRGSSFSDVPKDYRIILPPMPTGEGLKTMVVLHCDIAGRPYKIEDFSQPMRNAGIIEQVGGIGAYQMSHVWLVNFRTEEAKKKLLETKPFLVKGRTCVAIDPQRQEVRLKVHWCAFNVSNDAVRRAFVEYGEVKEVTGDKWKTGGFDNADSTTRVVRLILRDGVSLERIPHQMRIGNGTVLVIVPGRAPICLRCRATGHIRRDCKVPRCNKCRAYGHEEAECARSYARAAFRGTAESSELVMDEDEAEQAAANAASDAETGADAANVSGAQEGSQGQKPASLSAATAEAPAISASTATDAKDGGVASSEKQRDHVLTRASGSAASMGTSMAEAEEVGDVSASVEDDHAASMDLDSTSSKRRHDGATSVLQEQRLRQPEREWRVAGKKPRVTRAQRSSSLPRDDTEKT
ncbi:uncharacterized protein LOC125947554 [Dermacentor silvarum]|uniref:uncharacterized protein LOC125947554 n=1 Tax=Dermacentor silvarum TaxID=543639 RepID=UPI0021017163|nr:uncharacterized protein LOC125947554 [Dermacentor silvarum]